MRTPFPPFDRSLDLFGDGSVRLLAGGGHSPEDVMMLLALADGPVLLTGDAVVHQDWLRSEDVQRIASAPERAAAVRESVRLFAAQQHVSLGLGHDLSGLRCDGRSTLCHHPEWFQPSAWNIKP